MHVGTKTLLMLLGALSMSWSASVRDTLLTQLKADALRSVSYTQSSIDAGLKAQNTDGSFSDVKYDPKLSGVAITHPKRLSQWARCYVDTACTYYQDSVFKTAYHKSLSYWVQLNFQDANWFSRYIAYPLALWPAVILMESRTYYERRSLRDSSLAYLQWAWKSGLPAYKTGANLVNIIQGAFPASVLRNDTADVRRQMTALEGTLAFADLDGIHGDWTYSMHTSAGLQLYNGGYAGEFLKSVTALARLTAGSRMALSPNSIAQMEGLLLESSRWMSYGKTLDMAVMGRSIARKGAWSLTSSFLGPIEDLLEANPTRPQELARYRTEIQKDQWSTLAGTRLFWAHDYGVVRDSGWAFSVRATSKRTVANESGNGEGLLNTFMGAGTLSAWTDGKEYAEIFPMWNWNRIPGTTTPQNGRFTQYKWGTGGQGGSDFVGGASDGKRLLMTMVLDKDSTQARKFWFLGPWGALAMGAGISSNQGSPVWTSIEQNLWTTGSKTWGGSLLKWNDSGWAGRATWHRGKTYWLLDSTQALVSIKLRQGHWARINANYDSTIVQDTLFEMGIPHGVRPKSARYAYGISPDQGVQIPSSFGAIVLQNTDTLQAALGSDGSVGVVFYKAGVFRLPNGMRLGLDRGGVVLYDPAGWLTVSDPARSGSSLSGSWSANGQNSIWSTPLPQGDSLGSSIVIPAPQQQNVTPIEVRPVSTTEGWQLDDASSWTLKIVNAVGQDLGAPKIAGDVVSRPLGLRGPVWLYANKNQQTFLLPLSEIP